MLMAAYLINLHDLSLIESKWSDFGQRFLNDTDGYLSNSSFSLHRK